MSGHSDSVKQHIVIVGAGAIGLSCARAVLANGHRVTIIEQGDVPNTYGASYDQHRLIRYQYGESEGYTLMVTEAFAAWERLWAELGQRHYAETGTLSISHDPNDYVAQSAQTMAALGIQHDLLDRAQIEAMCPQLKLPSPVMGLYCSAGGALYADRIVDGLWALVRARGAVVRANTKVADVDSEQGVVTLTNGEKIHGDSIVVAAGAWLPSFSPAYTHLPTWRQALCYVRSPDTYADHWAKGPCISDIGVGSNFSIPPVGGTGLKFGSGDHRRLGAPPDGFESDPSEGHQVIARFLPYLREPDSYIPIRMHVRYYVRDTSGLFNVQRHGRAIVVTNCEGHMFKFTALMGERVAACLDDVISGEYLQSWAAGHRDVV